MSEDPMQETPQETAHARNGTPPLRTPSHGVGKLYAGGVPGNKGVGRPRSKVREAASLAFDERIEVLSAIADDVEAKDGDRVRAVDVLGRHAGIAKDEVIPSELVKLLATDVQAVVRSSAFELKLVTERAADEVGERATDVLLNRVYQRWAMTLGAYRAGDV